MPLIPLAYDTPIRKPLLTRLISSPAPTFLAPLTLLPIFLFIAMVFTTDYWSKWFQTGQRWERITGITWITIASLSLFWIALYLPRPKRWHTWICLALHILFLILSIFPGFYMIAWLMHWLSGLLEPRSGSSGFR
jgi:hypothetical protein